MKLTGSLEVFSPSHLPNSQTRNLVPSSDLLPAHGYIKHGEQSMILLSGYIYAAIKDPQHVCSWASS